MEKQYNGTIDLYFLLNSRSGTGFATTYSSVRNYSFQWKELSVLERKVEDNREGAD